MNAPADKAQPKTMPGEGAQEQHPAGQDSPSGKTGEGADSVLEHLHAQEVVRAGGQVLAAELHGQSTD